MIKSLTILALAAGMSLSASAIDLDDAVYSADTSTGFSDMSGTTISSAGSTRDLFSITVVMSYDSIVSMIDAAEGSLSTTSLITVTNSNGNNIVLSLSGTSETVDGVTTYSAYASIGTTASSSLTMATTFDLFDTSNGFYDEETGTVSLTFETLDTTNGSRIYASDGDDTHRYSSPSLRWSQADDGYNQITYGDTTALLSVYAFDSSLSAADAQTVATLATAALSVPEPATASLSLLGLGALLLRRRRA